MSAGWLVATAYLRSLVHNLCQALETKGAWITEYLASRRRLRSLAFWLDGSWIDEYEYDIEGTPCQPVIETCQLVHSPTVWWTCFPPIPTSQSSAV